MKTNRKIRIFNLVLVAFFILIATNCKTVNEPIFGGTVSDVDGNAYHTVTIGNQTWMIENLKTTHYNDNTVIPLVTDSSKWNSLNTPGYCWYNNDSTKYKGTFGALYNWSAVNTSKLAPVGWHVPTVDEWITLENNVTGYNYVSGSLAKILAATSNWTKSASISSVGNNLTVNNTSGFSALPGGYRSTDSIPFNKIDSVGSWWTSSASDSIKSAWYCSMDYSLSTVQRGYNLKLNGYSVRCVKNTK